MKEQEENTTRACRMIPLWGALYAGVNISSIPIVSLCFSVDESVDSFIFRTYRYVQCMVMKSDAY